MSRTAEEAELLPRHVYLGQLRKSTRYRPLSEFEGRLALPSTGVHEHSFLT
jgi:hypothetical protein